MLHGTNNAAILHADRDGHGGDGAVGGGRRLSRELEGGFMDDSDDDERPEDMRRLRG